MEGNKRRGSREKAGGIEGLFPPPPPSAHVTRQGPLLFSPPPSFCFRSIPSSALSRPLADPMNMYCARTTWSFHSTSPLSCPVPILPFLRDQKNTYPSTCKPRLFPLQQGNGVLSGGGGRLERRVQAKQGTMNDTAGHLLPPRRCIPWTSLWPQLAASRKKGEREERMRRTRIKGRRGWRKVFFPPPHAHLLLFLLSLSISNFFPTAHDS